MNEMIKRVAKAMAKADADNAFWKMYVREARAAIEAMREPTDAMINLEELPYSPGEITGFWQAMIDEALK